jgi:serine/threonine-protein kinase
VEPERRDLRWLLWVLLALLLIGGAIAAYLLLQPNQKTVPDVVGQKSATAAQNIQNAGFEVRIQPVQSDDVPKDRVISQEPGANKEADEGSTVTLVVSAGPGEVAIPEVVGLTQKSAENRLTDAGFKSRTTQDTSDTVEKGRVIDSSPPQGSLLEKGQTVTLTVSSGPEEVAVPDVVGKSRDDATQTLTNAGFKPTVQERETLDEDPGTVLEQTPKGGAKAAKDSEVQLVVAKAPPDVQVPEVLNQQRQDARDALHAAGFKVDERERPVTDPAQDGVVVDQNPQAGGSAPKGSKVTIVVGKLSTKPTPTPTPSPTP